jgi:hypothetical protein
MTLSAAAAIANGEAVSTQIEDVFDHERIKVKVIVGKRSTVRVTSRHYDIAHGVRSGERTSEGQTRGMEPEGTHRADG